MSIALNIIQLKLGCSVLMQYLREHYVINSHLNSAAWNNHI